MSAKHHQRTRAGILAKRDAKSFTGMNGTHRYSIAVDIARPVPSRSKYVPHFGAKQLARVAYQASALRGSMTLTAFRELQSI